MSHSWPSNSSRVGLYFLSILLQVFLNCEKDSIGRSVKNFKGTYVNSWGYVNDLFTLRN